MGMKILLEFVGLRLNGILGFLLRSGIHGVVLKVLWGWFVVPFINLPKLSIPIAMGIYLIVAFVKRDYRSDHRKRADEIDYDNEGAVKRLYLAMVMRAAATLSAGWIIHSAAYLLGN